MVSIDFVNPSVFHEFSKCIFKKHFGEIVSLIKYQITSELILLCQRSFVCGEVTSLSNSISRNFAKIMLYLRDMTNLAEIFEKS